MTEKQFSSKDYRVWVGWLCTTCDKIILLPGHRCGQNMDCPKHGPMERLGRFPHKHLVSLFAWSVEVEDKIAALTPREYQAFPYPEDLNEFLIGDI